MTRKSKLLKVQYEDKDIYFRTLSIIELKCIDNVKNFAAKYELGAKFALSDGNDYIYLPWQMLQVIGKTSIERSQDVSSSKEVFDVTLRESIEGVKQDLFYSLILKILAKCPGMFSYTELLNQTMDDIIEISAGIEVVTGQKIIEFENGKAKKGMRLNPTAAEALSNTNTSITKGSDGKTYFQDDGVSLMEKIKENQKFFNEKT